MDYKKPQSPLVQGSAGIYPLTTADQVILADGSRLEKDGLLQVVAADSARLGGKLPEEYADATVVAAHGADLGDAWAESAAYEAGDYCIHGNTLYKCLVANTGVVPADGSSEWERCTVAGELKAITDANREVELIPNETTLNVGDTFTMGDIEPRVLSIRINGSVKYAATKHGNQYYGSYVNINSGNMFCCRIDQTDDPAVYQIAVSKMCSLGGGNVSDIAIKGINILVM